MKKGRDVIYLPLDITLFLLGLCTAMSCCVAIYVYHMASLERKNKRENLAMIKRIRLISEEKQRKNETLEIKAPKEWVSRA